MTRTLAPLFAVAALAACGSPAHVAGSYSLTVVDRDNGCGYQGWSEGTAQNGIPFTIAQSEAKASGTVGGLSGTFMQVVLGSATFDGTVDGDAIDLVLAGTRAGSQGSCAYTVDAHLTGTIDGDFLTGTIEYTDQTNNSPDCGALTGCRSIQQLNGSRPPR